MVRVRRVAEPIFVMQPARATGVAGSACRDRACGCPQYAHLTVLPAYRASTSYCLLHPEQVTGIFILARWKHPALVFETIFSKCILRNCLQVLWQPFAALPRAWYLRSSPCDGCLNQPDCPPSLQPPARTRSLISTRTALFSKPIASLPHGVLSRDQRLGPRPSQSLSSGCCRSCSRATSSPTSTASTSASPSSRCSQIWRLWDSPKSAFGFGMGIFFVGYLVLEIPGTLIVERWSARKWISRIMISWGIVAALTAFVHYRVPGVTWLAEAHRQRAGQLSSSHSRIPIWAGSPGRPRRSSRALRAPGSPFVLQFFSVRFLLGLAEAGFYPGVIVYLTHWFPQRDRTKTLAWFFIGTPLAAIVGPPISERIMTIGVDGNPPLWGMVGWQWVFIFWGIPAVILGFLVLFYLTDRPTQARWLTDEERTALEETLAKRKSQQKQRVGHMTDPPSPGQPEGTGPRGGLLLRGHGKLRRRALHGVDRQGLVRRGRQERRLPDHYPGDRGAHRPALGRLEFGPHPRAPLACLAADHHGRGGVGPGPRHQGTSLADDRPCSRSP